MHLSDQQIKEIAENLDPEFMSIYIHKTKAEFVSLMYPDQDYEELEGMIGKNAAEKIIQEIKEVEDNQDQYVLIRACWEFENQIGPPMRRK